MITSHLGGGIFYLHIFKMAGNESKQNKKYHISGSPVSMLMMFILNYAFSGVLRQCVRSLTGEVRGHAHLISIKVKVILAK